jgi:hypothetical protein
MKNLTKEAKKTAKEGINQLKGLGKSGKILLFSGLALAVAVVAVIAISSGDKATSLENTTPQEFEQIITDYYEDQEGGGEQTKSIEDYPMFQNGGAEFTKNLEKSDPELYRFIADSIGAVSYDLNDFAERVSYLNTLSSKTGGIKNAEDAMFYAEYYTKSGDVANSIIIDYYLKAALFDSSNEKAIEAIRSIKSNQ